MQRGRRLQLDGLRWFAVLGVMISHYLDPHELYSNVGGWGVRMFFVLSGFLIGSILFDAKNRVTRSESSVGKELKNFYARRTLRIFPAFYLLVVVTWLLGNWSSAPFGWIALYAVNFWEVVHCEIAGIFGHLYTLCIEEHFYLFFPLLIFVVPLLRLNALLWTLICLGVIWRLVAIDILHLCNGTRLVFSELDSLAGGGAYREPYPSRTVAPRKRCGQVLDSCGGCVRRCLPSELLRSPNVGRWHLVHSCQFFSVHGVCVLARLQSSFRFLRPCRQGPVLEAVRLFRNYFLRDLPLSQFRGLVCDQRGVACGTARTAPCFCHVWIASPIDDLRCVFKLVASRATL